MRPIDADELTEMAWRERVDSRERIANLIARQPTIEAKPVKHGHWEDCSNGWMCSCCERDNTKDTPFCPNCGARMDGEQNEID